MGSSFYDNYIDYQVQSGINDRILGLYKRTKKIGITGKKILEIGCGIGALTFLLSKKIGKGKIEAFDPSEKSIAFAQQQISHPNIVFNSSDVLNFSAQFSPYDLILLFDVLEHIPVNDHYKVFSRIKTWMNDNSILMINLPNPEYILYDQTYQPDQLQELDQPVFLNDLLSIFTSLDLTLKHFETYSVWAKEDYQFFVLQKKTAFTEELLSNERSFFEKLVVRLRRALWKLKYQYPK